jgi:hypothetical protein
MTAQIIPLESTPGKDAYEFGTELEGMACNIEYRWNATYGAWFFDLSVIETGTTLLGLCMLEGSDILRPHAVIELGRLFMVDTENKQQNPDFDNLGDRYKLIYIPKADLL